MTSQRLDEGSVAIHPKSATDNGPSLRLVVMNRRSMHAPVLHPFAIYFTVGNLPTKWKGSCFHRTAIHVAILGIAAGRAVGLDQVPRPRVTGPSTLARLYRRVLARRGRTPGLPDRAGAQSPRPHSSQGLRT